MKFIGSVVTVLVVLGIAGAVFHKKSAPRYFADSAAGATQLCEDRLYNLGITAPERSDVSMYEPSWGGHVWEVTWNWSPAIACEVSKMPYGWEANLNIGGHLVSDEDVKYLTSK